jgi:hypothetical protein
LHAETGIHPKSLKNLLSDEGWRLDRDNYESLTRFAFNHGYDSVLHIEHHPIWETFDRKAHTNIYRGRPIWDAEIERTLRRFLQRIGGKPAMVIAEEKPRAIQKAMKETNCIFVGSPKSNAATEIALCLLYGATPFDASAPNRRKIPVQIVGADPKVKKSSAVLVPSRGTHQFEIAVRGGKEVLPVHWIPQEAYERWHGENDDAAVVIVCASPLGTSKPVTTILVMGYTGLATESAARQLTHGELPLMHAQLSQRGKTHILSYTFQFTKSHIASSRNTGDLRRAVLETGVWSLVE